MSKSQDLVASSVKDGLSPQVIVMFRTTFPILLCVSVSAVQSANPDNSDITYVKIQPITSHDTPQAPYTSLRESRIENIPLTIRNFHEETIRKIRSDEATTNKEIFEPTREEIDISEPTQVEINISEPTREEINIFKPTREEINIFEPTREENLELMTESINTKENASEIDTAPEERYYEKHKPGPRFYSKLSYFSKPALDLDSSLSRNLVNTRSKGRKKYRSRCRCERIWNCPKLQITVPRCPEEYFMCCF